MRILPGQSVGIEFGTTTSAIAQLDGEGNPVPIPSASGQISVPSVVLLGDNGRVVASPSLETVLRERSEHVVKGVKRHLGNREWLRLFMDKKLTPQFVTALILKSLAKEASQQIGAIVNAVITVPSAFDDVCRKAVQDAGRISGLNVIDLIREPHAVALAYAWQRGEFRNLNDLHDYHIDGISILGAASKHVLVFALGGATFEVTLLRWSGTSLHFVAADVDSTLGGDDWTNRIVDYVAEQFARQLGGADPREDHEAMLTLENQCETVKCRLSTESAVPIRVSFRDNSLTLSITRSLFEELTADLLRRTWQTTEALLERAGLVPADLHEILLVGSSTKMPAVAHPFEQHWNRLPTQSLDPAVVAAQGAAIHAAILEARDRGTLQGLSKLARNRRI